MRDLHFPGRGPAYATHGMAATSMPQATMTAVDVLRSGGNAMDAAIAAAAVLAVVEPQSTGIGGDVFCLYMPAGEGTVYALNGSGQAPAAATAERLRDRGVALIDPDTADAVTVPGAVAAWETLLQRFGTRDFEELLRPAIAYADRGYLVHDRVAADWAAAEARLRASSVSGLLVRGNAPRAGDQMTNPALARTLRAIAAGGSNAFYRGSVAASLVHTLHARGGVHTQADFAAGADAAIFVEPIKLAWQGYEVWECPPNGSGIIALMILGILDGFDRAGGPFDALRYHRHIEAARLAYRDRDAFLADPTMVDVPVDHLLSREYLDALHALIDDAHAMDVLPPPGRARAAVHKDTVYISVVDEAGNACSFINSIFESFGSAIYDENTGVLFHNRGASFTLQSGHPNELAPGKRPMHTIIPGMLTRNGVGVMPFGVMGGHFQPMGQTLFLTNVIEHGLDIQAAIDHPRVMPHLGNTVHVERSLPPSTREGLTARGHHLADITVPHGGGQAIWIDHDRGILIGGSDPRKDGLALGY